MKDMKTIDGHCDFCKMWGKVVAGPMPTAATICGACATEAMFMLPADTGRDSKPKMRSEAG